MPCSSCSRGIRERKPKPLKRSSPAPDSRTLVAATLWELGRSNELLSFSQSPSLGIRRFGRAEYKNRNRCGNPDANAKTCPDSNANVSHRCTDSCAEYDTNEYAQRQNSYAPA